MTEFEMDPMAYNDMSMCGITETKVSDTIADGIINNIQ